jgi:prolyl oligopeptidase
MSQPPTDGAFAAHPPARLDDETRHFFGVEVTTPYRWLDDPSSEETRAWIAAQNAASEAFFAGTRREAHVSFLERWCQEPPRILPIERGGWRYWLEQLDGQDQPALWCGTLPPAAPAPARLVVDPASRGAALEAELIAVSPSGRYVAYGLAALGSDGASIQVWDAELGRELPEVVAPTAVPTVAWHPSESGFFYNVTRRIIAAEVAGQDDGVYWHRLGRPTSEDRRLLALDAARAEAGPIQGLHPFVPEADPASPASVLFVAATNYVTSARGLSCWPLPAEPEAGLGAETVLFRDAEAPLSWLGARGAEHLFATRLGAHRGRVVAIDLERPGRDRWRVVVPELEDALTTDSYTVRARCGALCGDRLLLTYLHHASHRVRLFDLDGGARGELPLPPLVTVEEIAPVRPGPTTAALGGEVASPDGESRGESHGVATGDAPHAAASAGGGRAPLSRGARISTVDLLGPHTLYRWRSCGADAGAGSVEIESALPSPLDPADFEVEQLFVAARDGVRVPMTVVRPRSLDRAAPAPTFLYGYGGWGQSITPRYSPDAALWLTLGGVYAYANLRGGGEYGDAWREAGQGARKQTVFDDFQDAALRLIADGVTTPELLGIKGLSNGGLLTAACYNQRPDLYGAVISEIPLVDVLWLDDTDTGRAIAAELGNPRQDRALFEALRAYSPLHNVKRQQRKPPLLLVVAERDGSALPGQAYRYTAACQAAAAGDQLVLLRTLPGVGHVGWPRRVMLRALAEEMAFFETFLMKEEAR